MNLKVGGFERAKRNVRYTSHLHVRIDALGDNQSSFASPNCTEKLKCACSLRRQVEFGTGSMRRRIVVTRWRRGLVRNNEDILHLLEFHGLPLRRRRVFVIVQKEAAELHTAPAQRAYRLPARPRRQRTRPPLLLFHRPTVALFVNVLGSESVDWRVERAGGAHAHWAE